MINVGKDCIGCGNCVIECPQNCISLEEEKDGFLYPKIDLNLCIKCGLCIKKCPIYEKKKEIDIKNIKIYAGHINSKFIKECSSSGIYPKILEKFFSIYPDGIAYGVTLDEEKIVKHIEFFKNQNYNKILGSKYVQSDLSNVLTTIKAHLQLGKTILFSGTPCQIVALKRFVGEKYQDKLYTQSILCHGVSSPKILKKYIQFYEKKLSSKVIDINFREKKYGWENYGMKIVCSDGKNYFFDSKKDLFHKLFGYNISLRESCYICKYKYPYFQADVILGDFWNADSIYPEIYSSKGTSIIFSNSDRGDSLIQEILKDGVFKKINIKDALNSQKGIIEVSKRHKNRDYFFKDLDKKDFEKCVNKYAKFPFWFVLRIHLGKIYRKIKKGIKRLTIKCQVKNKKT